MEKREPYIKVHRKNVWIWFTKVWFTFLAMAYFYKIKKISIQIHLNQTFVNQTYVKHLCLKTTLLYHLKGIWSALKLMSYVKHFGCETIFFGSYILVHNSLGSQVIRIFLWFTFFPWLTNLRWTSEPWFTN